MLSPGTLVVAENPCGVPAPASPRKTRADYAKLSTDDVYRLLGRANCWAELVETEADRFAAAFLLQELRAALMERPR